MLTLDIATLPAGDPVLVHAIEIDTEHGHVQTYGVTDVAACPDGHGGRVLESGATGGSYGEPQTLGDVELWNVEDHYLAIFPDAASMHAGAREITRVLGDQLPVGIARVLTGGNGG